ncbi:hypothetical protein [Methylocystis sp. ATCC 49242]|uniref:hypothetical protein n=1 Tax=Methylocystis sp. ATCC 49242 TaxID=622637 RepID=UPI0001F87E4C|nr:hypothetical protein [Methylocystis sp. ATCC 49242]
MKTLVCPTLLVTALVSQAAMTPAVAHESRTLPASKKSIVLTVGFAGEPAFEDTFNGVDVILKADDGECPASASASATSDEAAGDTRHANHPHITAPIDTAAGDTVSLKVAAIYMNTATKPTGAGGSILPPAAGVRASRELTIEYPLKAKFNTPGTYQSFFRPTNPGPGTGANSGAYAFRVWGAVRVVAKSSTSCGGSPISMQARTATINSVFVCGPNGTMSADGSYNCIKSIQPFPGNAAEGYKPSTKF